MGLSRWNPVRDVLAMQNALDRMFDDTRRTFSEGTAMPLDIHEEENRYVIHSAIPGADPDSVQVRLHDGVLTIGAEVRPRMQAREERDATEGDNGKTNGQTSSGQPQRRTLIQENFYGKYTRSVRLPETVEEDNVTAEYENGILTLTLPKVPKAQPKQISVNFKK